MEELKNKYVDKFFGEDKITDIAVTEATTPLGSLIFELTFLSGKKLKVPEKGLVLGVSDEKKDATATYSARLNAISEECVKIVAEYDLPSYLFDRIGKKIELELNNHVERAASIVWNGNADSYAPGFSTQDSVTLTEADILNAKFPPKTDVAG